MLNTTVIVLESKFAVLSVAVLIAVVPSTNPEPSVIVVPVAAVNSPVNVVAAFNVTLAAASLPEAAARSNEAAPTVELNTVIDPAPNATASRPNVPPLQEKLVKLQL